MGKRIAIVGVIVVLALALFLVRHVKEPVAALDRENVPQSTAKPSAVDLATTNGPAASTRTFAGPERTTAVAGTETHGSSRRQAAMSSSDPTYGLGMLARELQAAAGTSATWKCSFDSNPVIYVRVIRIGAGARYEVTGPGGLAIRQSTPRTDTVSSDAFLDEFEFSDPPVGAITVHLTAGPGAAATLNIAFLFGNGTVLASGVSPLIVTNIGASAQLLAELADDAGKILVGREGVFTAIVLRPDGSQTAVAMFDDGRHGDGESGDGEFGATLDGTMTTLEGRYSVLLSGSQTIGDSHVERSQDIGFVVKPSGAVLVGGLTVLTPDKNRNGLFDSLQFSQQVSFSSNGTYRLVGNLKDSRGSNIEQLSAEFSNTQGAFVTALTLSIDGDRLVYHGVDGPWSLTSISLIKEDAGSLPVCTAPDFTTDAYLLSAFEHPPAPTIFDAIPDSGSIAGGDEIVVAGKNLFGATSVLIGGQAATFTVRDDNTIAVTAPRAKIGPPYPASVEIKVTTPWGVASRSRGYAYGP